MGATAIITASKTGSTARMISKFRPACPIICCTTNPQAQRQMNLSWGVIPLMAEEKNDVDELCDHASELAVRAGLIENGELIVFTAGSPLGVSGTTNLLKVHLVGHILAKGDGVTNYSATGNLCVAHSEQEALENYRPGDILVINHTTNALLPVLKEVSGVITEVGGTNSHAAIVGMALELPVLVGVENAVTLLKSGATVTLDAERGIVMAI